MNSKDFVDDFTLPYTGSMRRLTAYLIDIFPIITLVIISFYYLSDLAEVWGKYVQSGKGPSERADFLTYRNKIRSISFALWILYCLFAEASSWQGTLGKRLMGIKVVDQNGLPLTFQHSLKRNAAKVFSYLLLFVGFIVIIFDSKKRGWHDRAALTFVVDR